MNHFPEEALGHAGHFAISILSSNKKKIQFDSICSLFHPITIDQSYEIEITNKKIPEIRNETGWITDGHPDRIISFDENQVNKIHEIFMKSGKQLDAPVLSIYAKPLFKILLKRSEVSTFRQHVNSFKGRSIFDENNGLKEGLIIKATKIPEKIGDLILSSPHFYVGTPFIKQPNEGCKSKGNYSHIDLLSISEMFIHRALFRLSSPNTITQLIDQEGLSMHIKSYRLVWRTWVSPNNERTLITAIIPPNVLHVYPTHSMPLGENTKLLLIAGLTFSIIYDFFIRVMGIDHVWDKDILNLPYPDFSNERIIAEIIERTLMLTCITQYFSELWNKNAYDGSIWEQKYMFLSHKSRRDALLEL